MKRLAFLALLLAACERPLTYVPYSPATKEFTAEVPAGWRLDERRPFDGKPLAEVRWIGKVVEEHEGEPYGAILTIRRISRSRKDFPTAKEYAAFKKNVLDQGEAVFSGKAGVPVTKTADGFRYARRYEQTLGGGLHGPARALPMRAETVVRRTKLYDYVLEFRATEPLYERNLPAFLRLNETFKLAK